MSLKIDVEVIPHDCQRYPTVGDWQFLTESKDIAGQDIGVTHENILQVNVSETGNEDSNFLIAIHEIIEAYLCKKNGITEEQVDQWDKDHLYSFDPGSFLECPYFHEHIFATFIEHKLAIELEVHWEDHEKRIGDLFRDDPLAL